MKRLLEKHLYVEGSVVCRPHVIQVQTDDDELEMAYYFFDDHFLAKHAGRAAFILHEDWRLPEATGEEGLMLKTDTRKLAQKGRGAGVTYVALLAWYDSANLSHLEGAVSIRGVRLPDLARYLATTVPPSGAEHEGGWPFELRLLRSQLLLSPAEAQPEEELLLQGLRDHPEEAARWQVHADWLEEHGQRRNAVLERALSGAGRYPVGYICNSLNTGTLVGENPAAARALLEQLVAGGKGAQHGNDPAKSLVQADDHVAQLVLHTARWGDTDSYHRWVMFDDLWAGAHPDLAKAILRYANRWDVLS